MPLQNQVVPRGLPVLPRNGQGGQMNRIIVGMLLWSLGGSLFAQTAISDLRDEIDAGRVQLVSVAGNGSSSGTAITAYLLNETATVKRVDVNLSRPLFLVNTGSSQNMIGIQVYLSDGAYSRDGRRSYITLRPRVRTGVLFVAFCVDFDKDNPSERDRFSIGTVPPVLAPVMANIRGYISENPNVDVTVAAQAAVWLAQKKSIGEIRSRFPVTSSEERLARQFIR